MFQVRIISIRKNTDHRIASLEADYQKRLKSVLSVTFEDIRQTYAHEAPAAEILKKEAELVHKRLNPNDYVLALSEGGQMLSSVQLSQALRSAFGAADTARGWTIVIGGPYGLDASILNRAQRVLSLSKFTLTHELARLILLEALYRASEILRGSKYHK